MKIALLGYGKMGKVIEKIALERGHQIVLRKDKDSSFVSGTVTSEEGRFYLAKVNPGMYFLEFTYIGYASKSQPLFVGNLN